MSRIVATPILIGPRNSEVVTGIPWRRLRDAMVARGVPRVFVGRAGLFRPADVEAELARSPLSEDELGGEVTAEPVLGDPADPAEEIRRRLGLRRRTG